VKQHLAANFTEKWLKFTSREVAHYYFARNSKATLIFISLSPVNVAFAFLRNLRGSGG
jgi:hypothetical protein